MQYKVTNQYINDVESPLAEFVDINDSELFIANKSENDRTKSVILIYRLYNNTNLLSEYNLDKCNSPVSRAQYAQGDIDLPEHFAEAFRVTYRAQDNKEYILATFRKVDDTRLFIEAKFMSNRHQNISKPTYMIYDISRLVEIIDQTSFDAKNARESQKKGKKLAFRPTPFSMKLTMGPKNFLVEEDDDEDKEKDK